MNAATNAVIQHVVSWPEVAQNGIEWLSSALVVCMFFYFLIRISK